MNINLLTPHTTLIVGLSGGADSVYLLYQLAALKAEKNLTLIAAHLDHEWRAESNNDALFCKELCASLNIQCIIQKASMLNFTPTKTGSKEDIGRQMRRYFFEHIRASYNADAIALAHHQDDQLETFFIRLARGSSLEGLCGIKEKSGFYIRPLLTTSKKAILDYLKKHNYSYAEDASNASDSYLRNRIRNHALPTLQTCDARFTTKCLDSITHLQAAEIFIQEHTITTYNTIGYLDTENNRFIVNSKKLLALNEYMQKRVIQLWLIKHALPFAPSNNFLEEIIRFIQSKKGGSHMLGTSWKIIKKQSNCWIEIIY